DEDKRHARTPAGIHKPFEPEPRNITGCGDLKNYEQRHHAGNDPQHCRTGAKGPGIQHHGAAQNDLKRKRVEEGKQKRVVQPVRKRNRFGHVWQKPGLFSRLNGGILTEMLAAWADFSPGQSWTFGKLYLNIEHNRGTAGSNRLKPKSGLSKRNCAY